MDLFIPFKTVTVIIQNIPKSLVESEQKIVVPKMYGRTLWRGARGVMVIVIGNGHWEESSNPDEAVLHTVLIRLRKVRTFNCFLSSYEWTKYTVLFNLDMATSLREGKLNLNLLKPHLKIHLVSHPAQE